MTKKQAVAFRKRWQAVNDLELKELRKTSLSQKLRQIDALMASVKRLGWTRDLKRGEAEVRARWMRLKEAYHA